MIHKLGVSLMKKPEHFEPLMLNGKPAKYGDVKTWQFVKAWRNTKQSGEAALIAEVKCKECGAETLFTAKSVRSCTAAACVHDPYAPVGQDVFGKKALPTIPLHTWMVISYVPGSKKVKSLYNCECTECGKEVQFVSGDFRPDRIVACNHDLDVKQGVGSDHAWWSRNPLPDDKKGWHIIEMHSQVGNEKARYECKCLTCDKIAFFNTSNYRNGDIPECNHSPDRIYGIGGNKPKVKKEKKKPEGIFDAAGIKYTIEELIQIYGYTRFHWTRALAKHPIVDDALEFIKKDKR